MDELKQLVDEYVRAAHMHANATEDSRPEGTVEAVRAIVQSVRRILILTNGDRSVFITQLSHCDPSVRLWAATHALPQDRARAIAAIENIARPERGYVLADATATLHEIRLGRFRQTEQ